MIWTLIPFSFPDNKPKSAQFKFGRVFVCATHGDSISIATWFRSLHNLFYSLLSVPNSSSIKVTDNIWSERINLTIAE
ncbi:hypothetical protein PAAL109150_15695 [Paenibacillus alkaliterrae]